MRYAKCGYIHFRQAMTALEIALDEAEKALAKAKAIWDKELYEAGMEAYADLDRHYLQNGMVWDDEEGEEETPSR